MKRHLLRDIGKSLMLPISIFPLAALLNGIGYGLEQLDIASLHVLSSILQILGETILDHMPMIFAVALAYDLNQEKNGFCALNGLSAYLIITTLLSTEYIATYRNISVIEIDTAFSNIDNQFTGILAGVTAAQCYRLISGRSMQRVQRYAAAFALTVLLTLAISGLLYFVWPILYRLLIALGSFISAQGALGAGIYAFLNRFLIPFGMHHILNSVFWFDLIGINDISNFWSSTGTWGVTGMYQAGFFPVMMFGLPAAALAFYHTADTDNKPMIRPFLITAALASLLSGVTEPLEFSFLFLAPRLYLLHSLFCALSVFLAAAFQWIAGFSFSAGLIDFLLSFNMPMARSPIMLLILGLFIGMLYYGSFRFLIIRFNLMTPGRDPQHIQIGLHRTITEKEADQIASILIDSVGGTQNIAYADCCVTRLRLRLYNPVCFNFEQIKKSGAQEYRQWNDEYQIVYGPQVDLIMQALSHKLPSRSSPDIHS